MTDTCTVVECTNPYHCRGYCRRHYMQSYYGKLPKGEVRSRDPKVRYNGKIDKTPTCWLWLGAKDRMGYGRISVTKTVSRLAHRVFYEAYKGVIPNGLSIDHLCEVKGCVNPEHLEAVSHRVNIARHYANRHITHCPHGHKYDKHNTYINPKNRRICRICTRLAGRSYRKRIKDREISIKKN